MEHEKYMQRCLDLAVLAKGKVSPNPMVGCVIVHNECIIGEGYHQQYGEAHAEVNAINSVFSSYPKQAAQWLKEATAYVSLEPCAHYGKTPPCADLLIEHQLKRVVIGNTDPFAGVNGKGIGKLKEAGIEVMTGILEAKCSEVNRRFFTRITQHRPYIILKWAQTQDGYFAPSNPQQRWITGPEAKTLVHLWRSEEYAVLVGKKTALIDNPQLNTREIEGKNPIRLIIDKSLDIPQSHHLYNQDAKTIIFNEVKTDVAGNINFIEMEDMHFYLPQKLAYQLYLMDIQSVIIEGGINLLQQFIDANLWDEARIFTGNTTWNEGLKAPQVNGETVLQTAVGKDSLEIIRR
jgi:diaminohydroxyphosphoribosylaminopyrimidine deaminase/5-amino-6-(5-phosphoribosylamino)uracil reductase